MGQILPLPERIPKPNAEQRNLLSKHGITVEEDATPFWKISLPSSYEMINNSAREDIPQWYIIRKGTNMACADIVGSWKGTHDNDIRLRVYPEEKEVTLRNTPPIPSETSNDALLHKALATGDPRVGLLALNAIEKSERK